MKSGPHLKSRMRSLNGVDAVPLFPAYGAAAAIIHFDSVDFR